MTVQAHELGSRVMRALHEENDGNARFRVLAIVMRWYGQYKAA